jgi:hypothetical protein
MANATATVPMSLTAWNDDKVHRDLSVSGAATYYKGAMMALNASGHAVKCDDTANLTFDGIAVGFSGAENAFEVATTDTLGEKKVVVQRPYRFGMYIAAATAADIGAPVYALYDNEVTLTGTNGIQVGWIDSVKDATFVRIRPVYTGQHGDSAFDSETLTFDGTTGNNNLVVPDNLADALSIKIDSGADLMTFTTTDSAESVNFPNNVTFFGDAGTKKVVSVSTTSVAETLTTATGEYETRLTDNLADAHSIKVTSGADMVVFTTTDNAEQVAVTGLRTAQSTAVAITGATTLKLSDSGGTFTVSQGAAYDIDLPSPTTGAGCSYFFHLTAPAANAVTITVAGAAATFVGSLVSEGQIIVATGSTLTFASGAALLGDSIEIRSLATNLYHVRAVSSALNGVTVS